MEPREARRNPAKCFGIWRDFAEHRQQNPRFAHADVAIMRFAGPPPRYSFCRQLVGMQRRHSKQCLLHPTQRAKWSLIVRCMHDVLPKINHIGGEVMR